MDNKGIWSETNISIDKWREIFRFTSLSFVIRATAIPLVFLFGLLFPRLLTILYSSSIVGVLGSLSPRIVWGLINGVILLVLILILRLDTLAIALVVIAHTYLDWYLGMTFVALPLTMGLLGIFFLARSPQYPWVKLRPLPLWVAWLTIALFATTRAPSILYGADYYTNVICIPLIALWLGMIVARNRMTVERLFQLFGIFAVMIAVHTEVQAATGTFLLASSRRLENTLDLSYFQVAATGVHRAESFLLNADSNGAFLAIMLLIPLTLFIASKHVVYKMIYLGAALIILPGLLFTYSTAAWGAALAGVIVLLALVKRSYYWFQILLFGLIIVGVTLIRFPGQVALQFSHSSNLGELQLRYAAWQTGLNVIQALPLTGLGIGRDVYALGSIPYLVPGQYLPLNHPHNSYIELAALGGLPLLVLFIALIGYTIWHAWRNYKQEKDFQTRCFLAGGIAITVALSIDSLFNAGWTLAPLALIGWLVLGIISSPLISKRSSEANLISAKSMSKARNTYLAVSVLDISIPSINRTILYGNVVKHIDKRKNTGNDHIPLQRPEEKQGYASQVLGLLKSSGIYALGSLVSPLVALIIAPFLTRNLSRADYGALAVLNTLIILLAGITQLGITAAFFRAYNYSYESRKDRRAILSTTVIMLSLVSATLVLLMMLTAPYLAQVLLGSSSFAGSIRLTALVILLQNLAVPGFLWLRAEKRAISSSILTIVNVLVTLGITLILIGILHQGINGSIIANGVGYAAIVVCTLPVIFLRAGFRLRVDIARDLFLFGWPNIFSSIAYWILQLSDRYLLSIFGSLTQTASYTIAYTLGGAVAPVLLGPFSLAWPPIMYEIAKKENAAHTFQVVFRWFVIVLLFTTFGLSLLSNAFLNLLFPASYHSVGPLIPIIALSYLFYGVYNMFMIGVYIRRRMSFNIMFMAFSALVNFGFNIFLIPRYGALGAAIATLLAYIFLAAIAYIVNQRIYPIPFEIGLLLFELAIGVICYVGSSFLASKYSLYTGWGISTGILLLYGIIMVSLGILITGKRSIHPKIYRRYNNYESAHEK